VIAGALRRVRRDDNGTVVVEFAMVSAVFLLLMFALADIGLVEIGGSVGSNAARDGARYAIVNGHYVNADQTGSTNNNNIKTEVSRRLAGLVAGTPTVAVQCLNNSTSPATPFGTTPQCTAANVVPGESLVEVTVTWTHISATPFVPNKTHTEKALMVIAG
jgi:Flp pilus assembly protein TadG